MTEQSRDRTGLLGYGQPNPASGTTLGWREEERRGELRRAAVSGALCRAYRFGRLRKRVVSLALRLEGGPFWSATARELLEAHHGVRVGAYSYGPCMIPGEFPPGVTVGRYASVAPGVRVFVRNHPMERLSLHPFFYNHKLGLVGADTIASGTVWIGHDAWIGERAIITPRCHSIGVGAVVGAGSVVTGDVPDFAIVAGSPARLLRYRFEAGVRDAVIASRWWERPVSECAAVLGDMLRPLSLSHPLLNGAGAAGL